LKVGNVVRVKAQVNDYRGTLQIKLRSAADFNLVSAPAEQGASPPTSP